MDSGFGNITTKISIRVPVLTVVRQKVGTAPVSPKNVHQVQSYLFIVLWETRGPGVEGPQWLGLYRGGFSTGNPGHVRGGTHQWASMTLLRVLIGSFP